MDLAGIESETLSPVGKHDEVAVIVHSLRFASSKLAARSPLHSLSLECITLPVGREHILQALLTSEPCSERIEQCVEHQVAVNPSAGLDAKRRRTR